MKIILIFLFAILSGGSTLADSSAKGKDPDSYQLQLTAKYPHDPRSFTQGLVYMFDQELGCDVLYESVGRYRESRLLKTNLKSGEILQSVRVPDSFFAEGLVLFKDRLYQLTWMEHRCLIYDRKTFKLLDEQRYAMQGWGLASDGIRFYLSDGSASIYIIDPENFRVQKKIAVHYRNNEGKSRPLPHLNELEYINGEIWANIYQSNYIVRIDPGTGKVLQFFNCADLVPESLKENTEFVLNGIAYDPANGRIFITGKYWPILYELKIERGK
ncbi:MAG: glutaminyl-peptide cyclotransferase [Planctomycetia bacterium]|nr:glutaminyl-peptide cyclotransferase [Planctomycetia bacterium]